MRKLRVTVALACALGALSGVAVPSPAAAAGLAPPVADCSLHGRLTRHYSVSALRKAIATMPADVAEYSNCPEVLNRALLAHLQSLKGGGPSGGGGSFLPTWVIAILVVLLLTGGGTGALALRNRRRSG